MSRIGAGGAGAADTPDGPGGTGEVGEPERPSTLRALHLALAVVGAIGLGASTLLAAVGVEPARDWYFQAAWYPTLLLLDGGLALRTGRTSLSRRPRFALSLLFWSAPTWYFFELLNLRLANWYYVFVPASPPLRWLGSFAAFATVLPALHLAHRWMDELGLARTWSRPTFEVRRRHYAICVALGTAFLALTMWRPDAFFPLVWGAATLLLEPYNHARDPRTSLLGDLSRGSWTRIVRILAGGALIGLLWESFNALAGARWIYTVPGLEHLKLFEMPLPGFLGFPVFALDGFVIYHALVHAGVAVPGWSEAPARSPGTLAAESGSRPLPATPKLQAARALPAAGLALLFCALVQMGVDRWTVDSTAPRLSALPGEPPGFVRRIEAAGVNGVRDLAGADSLALARRAGVTPDDAGSAVRAARLASLRGLGTTNAAALWKGGVRSVCGLARTPEARIASLVRSVRDDPRAGRAARVRVWLRAARSSCPERPHERGP